ncbi:hypothetical protein [Paraburkholderia sp. C35]|uniref:hypothetical protein n=1 Tax=Paraburkholderia sp. C35 TaxID=2126993 RepID=UPI0013A5A98F|nr:hypothetical protein [Paraburkholderia sp. C35]
MEKPRMHFLNQRQPLFDGPPVAHWQHGTNESLPPAPDKPKPEKTAEQKAKEKLLRGQALLIARDGGRKWTTAPDAVQEMHKRADAGESVKQISKSMGKSYQTVYGILNKPQVVHTAPEQLETEKKRCSACKQILEASAFYPNRAMRDGLQSRCKACVSRLGKAGYHARKAALEPAIQKEKLNTMQTALEALENMDDSLACSGGHRTYRKTVVKEMT